ncbi:MAG: beta-galactosidase trimerization domain-containing protein [Proteobacteria bacterium]|nr:beta-galactosidase trimerization domain-containing protein [Pseudomonadota bacterium]
MNPSRYNRLLLDMHIPDWDAEFLSLYDPAKVAATQAAARAGSVMVYCQSHLGLCYWPTAVGRRHAAMGDRDWLGEALAALRRANVEVFGYYSVIFNNAAYVDHPDWRIEPPPPVSGWAFHGKRYGQVCPNNPEYRKFVEAQLCDLFGRYRFDGFFFDMTFWRSVCECPSCQARFLADTGHRIPAAVDWADPVWCAFQSARERWLLEFAAFLTTTAKGFGIASVYHNFAVSLFNWKHGMSFDLAEQNDFLGGDFYGDSDEQFFISRFMLNLSKTRPIEFMTSRCVHLTDHVSIKPTAQLEAQAHAALTCAAAFRLIDAIDPRGTVCDEVYALLGSVFEKIEAFQPYLGGEPVEDVAVYVSDYSKMNPAENGNTFKDPATLGYSCPHLQAAKGAVRRLREARIPVGVITRKQLPSLDRYKVVVLPEVFRMSAEEVAAFTAYVAGGGSLYVSGMTGSYTLEGRSPDMLLGACLGLQAVGPLPGTTFYVRPADPAWREALRPQTVIYCHESLQQIAARSSDVETLATLSLPYAHPHEGTADDRSWSSIHSSPPHEDTNLPTATEHRFGAGRAIYSVVPLERSDHHAAGNSFRWLIDRLMPDGPSFRALTYDHVWLTVFHQPEERRFILHLLNYPADLPPVPVRDIRLELGRGLGLHFDKLLRLPESRELPLSTSANGQCEAVVDELRDYAMLVLGYR